jgi:AraC-like DNA-binding protein
MTDDAKNRLSLTAIGQNQNAARWRTEAMRSHSSPRLLYFNKGQGRITLAGLTSGYGPNNLIFIPAHVMYGFEAGSTVFGQMLAIPAAMASEWPDEPVHLRLRDVVVQKEATAHFENLERELHSDRSGHSRAAHYYLGILSVFFQRQVETRGPDPNAERAQTTSARLVAAYTDLVERDYATGRGVSDFARALGVTPTHLTRCCKQTCGKSAHAILSDRLIYEARVQLRDSGKPVKRIAEDLGFNSPAYFTRNFQHRTGMTPSAFRKRTLPGT